MAAGLRPGPRGRLALAIWLVVPALLIAAPALGQPSATDEPRVSGPLYLVGMSCGDDKLMHEGKPLARVDSCVRLYEFDSLMETDVTRTYGVAWVQTTIDPLNGWCATKARAEVILPNTVTRHRRAPVGEISSNKKDRVKVKLTTTADGHALENASVSQSIDVYPKSLTPRLANGGRTVRTEWRGEESDELAFVSAVEISWSILDTPQIRGGLGEMSFLKAPKC